MAKSYLIASLVLFRNLPNFSRKRSGLEFIFGSSLGFCKNHFLNSILYRFYQLSLPFQNIHFSFKKISQIFSALNSVQSGTRCPKSNLAIGYKNKAITHGKNWKIEQTSEVLKLGHKSFNKDESHLLRSFEQGFNSFLFCGLH